MNNFRQVKNQDYSIKPENQRPSQNPRNSIFTQQTPKPKKSYFFQIMTVAIIIVVIILLNNIFAHSEVGTALNISLDYDTNTIKLEDGKLKCIEDDRIFQWHKGLQMWECKKPTSSVFGELDKNNVKVNDSGNLECKENGKVLFWDKDQWNCGDASNTNFILTENGLELDKNKISIDSPTCNENEKLIWNGSNFTCEEDKDEDKQTLSFKDNVLSILNGNTIDLSGLKVNDYWKLGGNSNIDDNSYFIGTTNSEDLVFKTDDEERMRIYKYGGGYYRWR